MPLNSRWLPGIALLLALLLAPRVHAQPAAAPSSQPATTGPTSGPVPAGEREVDDDEEIDDDEEVDDEEEIDDEAAALDLDRAPFNEAQRKFLKAWAAQLRARQSSGAPRSEPAVLSLKWRAEIYNKILYQNDQSQGSVTYGTPHPRGDNYTGNNGFASEITLYVDGRVSDKVEAGARIKSRFHRQWADFYENGDLAVDETGLPAGADATGESLGANHAAYLQLRGIYLRMHPPIPTIETFHAGSSDLGMFNAWTIGKVRYIDRDNANGLFLDGAFGPLHWTLARISLPKLYASAGWTTGIDDPLVENPFWTRDASYALKVAHRATDRLSYVLIGQWMLDEEADLNDPDALGSTNFIDDKDGVVATLPRYQNANATLELSYARRIVDSKLLLGYSFSDPDLDYVFNSVDGNQGISPIPLKTAHSYAVKARVDLLDPFDIGLDLQLEYFNIGEDWVASFGARRETDVLLTDGFLQGQTPTLNVANEFIDFSDPFYESIVGWHGVTLVPRLLRGALELGGELTLLEYNTDAQDRCTGSGVTDQNGIPIGADVCPVDRNTGRPYGVYPDFLFSDGMTDSDFFSYANTNDRGRDPRSVYRQNQARRTLIGVLRLSYLFDLARGLRLATKLKYIRDEDLRDRDLEEADDYLGHLLFSDTSMATQVNDELSVKLGFRFDFWDEAHRSGAIVAGVPDYPDYRTWKTNLYLDLRYTFGGVTLGWLMQWLNKDVEVTRDGVRDEALSFAFRHIVRGLGTISAAF